MRIVKSVVFGAAIASLLLLAACGKFFVSGNSLVSIALKPTAAAIQPAKTQQFTATGTYGDGTTKDISSSVTWTSSSSSVATISSTGLATGVAVGTTTITASSPATSGSTTNVTANTTLTVSNVVVQTLAISPSNASIRVGQTQQYTATATMSDGTTKDVTTSTTWTSSSPANASITSAGLATGIASGSTTISATYSGFNATTPLTVTAF